MPKKRFNLNNLIDNLFVNPFWTRSAEGNNFYFLDDDSDLFGVQIDPRKHPILTPALLFVAKIFSQARFSATDKKTKKDVKDHWFLNLIKNPNPYQSQSEFLENLIFDSISRGMAVLRFQFIPGFSNPTTVHLIDYRRIEFPNGFDNKLIWMNKGTKYENAKVKYWNEKKDGYEIIKLKELLFYFDLPADSTKDNPFRIDSRLKGLNQTLINTNDSLIAKNIILKTNGKEMITGKGGANNFPLSPSEKNDVELTMQNNYGLSKTRKRTIITQASLDYKSLHIALRDLGLDESVKVDGNLIYTALHIPKDILSLEAKKTTYNNFNESMTSYVQNEIQSDLNSLIDKFNKFLMRFDETIEVNGDYDTLPIMQNVKNKKFTNLKLQSEALASLIKSGIPQELALEMCEFDPNIKLDFEQMPVPQVGVNNNENTSQNEETKFEPKLKKLSFGS